VIQNAKKMIDLYETGTTILDFKFDNFLLQIQKQSRATNTFMQIYFFAISTILDIASDILNFCIFTSYSKIHKNFK